MVYAEKVEAETVLGNILDDEERELYTQLSGDIFNVLVTLTSGEPLQMLQTCGFNGAEAWRRLVHRYNPNTPLRAMNLMMQVVAPARSQEMRNVPADLDRWETKVHMLKRDFGKDLSDRMKSAILISFLPVDVRDALLQQAEKFEKFEVAKERVASIVESKMAVLARGGAVPMEVGQVDQWGHMQVDAVSRWTQCFNCDGWGHTGRFCPSDKRAGKGKGEYGKGEYGKGEKGRPMMKGHEKGAKGFKGKGSWVSGDKGKGYQGACFECGKVGHKAWECRQARAVQAVTGDAGNDEERVDGEEIDVATVWDVGNVDAGPKTSVGGRNGLVQITLDSGAGANCWPANLWTSLPMQPKQDGVRFRTANGQELKYHGRKLWVHPCGRGGRSVG